MTKRRGLYREFFLLFFFFFFSLRKHIIKELLEEGLIIKKFIIYKLKYPNNFKLELMT